MDLEKRYWTRVAIGDVEDVKRFESFELERRYGEAIDNRVTCCRKKRVLMDLVENRPSRIGPVTNI